MRSIKKIIADAPWVAEHVWLPLDNIPRKKWWRYPQFIVQGIAAVWKSFWTFARCKPVRVVSMGGYVSIPVCIAAWMVRIPIDLYELNAVPGKAVTFLARCATRIYICFPETRTLLKHTNIIDVAYPVRFVPSVYTREQARAQLGLQPHTNTVCILGGSQGSAFMNTLAAYCATISDIQIIHQTGEKEIERVHAQYSAYGVPALVFTYRTNMELCYQAADVIVCRAGAGTLFEILFFKKPALVIPLKASTTDHQVDNAYAMVRAHPTLFKVLRQQEIETNKNIILAEVKNLIRVI